MRERRRHRDASRLHAIEGVRALSARRDLADARAAEERAAEAAEAAHARLESRVDAWSRAWALHADPAHFATARAAIAECENAFADAQAAMDARAADAATQMAATAQAALRLEAASQTARDAARAVRIRTFETAAADAEERFLLRSRAPS